MSDKKASSVTEINFDGLAGPTHNYGALAYGNVPSIKHKYEVSNPQAAALQGLAKMKRLMDLGCPQAVFPPPLRPAVGVLRQLGFRGDDAIVLQQAYQHSSSLFNACCSASNMWAANIATVSPSSDSADRRVHFTPSNLTTFFHRSIEVPFTTALLQRIFSDERYFKHHAPLPSTWTFSDEGAANHHRLGKDLHQSGLQMFVYNHAGVYHDASLPARYPARQSLLAAQAVSRAHRLASERVLFAQQSPQATDEGAFHNDLLVMSHRNVLLYHETAFVAKEHLLNGLHDKWHDAPIYLIELSTTQLSLHDALTSYFFNSQLVSVSEDSMALIAPDTCQENKAAASCIDSLLAADNPINAVYYVDCTQSMQGGGGPACLRLRVVLNKTEQSAMHEGVMLTPSRYEALVKWVKKHYRDHLHVDDLRDPQLLEANRVALDELTTLLDLASFYDFQYE